MKKNYSSRSAYATPTGTSPRSPMFGGLVPPPIKEVTVNPDLLTPLNLEIDPVIYHTRIQEKEEIKSLNNRFASFIDKVRFLEQQNQMLETKWSLLQEQNTTPSNLKAMYEAYIGNMRRQLDHLKNDKEVLERDLVQEQQRVEEFKVKYEREINKRTDAENEFVLLKKDVDASFMNKIELEAKRDSLEDELAFFRALYETELNEMRSQIKDTSVVLEIDNSRNLNMDAIVVEVRSQYEDIAKRSRAEAETWYKQKFEEMQTSASQYSENLRSNKAEIADMNRKISRLRNEIDTLKVQNSNLESEIADTETDGDKAVSKAKDIIRDLEETLQRDKQNMARQVREYQELMNIKLGLDIEIATYRKLLEGEEFRLASGGAPVNVYMLSNRRH